MTTDDKLLNLAGGLFMAVCGIGMRITYGGPRRPGENIYRYQGRVVRSAIGAVFALIVGVVLILEAFVFPPDWIQRVVDFLGGYR